jgi:DNA-binding transcriptional regulator GbsR (MarR family)
MILIYNVKMDIDFQKIQTKHEKAQQDSFEALCCQIFQQVGRKERWYNNAKFINKNGKAGDAGVEAYWKFNNGDEYAIQAKFSDSLDNLWSQINSSVGNALDKHPNLKKYYICTPFNRTELKQIKVDGEPKNDGMTKWNDYVGKWKQKKDIDFIWFGKSELEMELIEDNQFNSGIIKYWFDKNVFTNSWFEKHFEEVKIKANNRYSVDLNIQTSTKSNLLDIAKTKSSLSEYKKTYKELKESYDTLKGYNCFSKLQEEDLINKIDENFSFMHDILYQKEVYFKKDVQANVDEVITNISKLSWKDEYKPEMPQDWHLHNIHPTPTEDRRKKEWADFLSSETRNFSEKLYKLSRFVQKINNKNYLLFSTAGNGKTHLFCDIINEMTKNKEFIGVLSFGHFYYEKTLQESVLKQFEEFYNIEELLGALNSFAKTKNQTALFLIDGINEWETCDRPNIFTEIKLLKNKIDAYENLRLIISCRTEYKTDIFGERNNYNNFYTFNHYGFLDNSVQALYDFCNHYNIEPPSMPLLSPELSNPLILKTLCEAFQDIKKFPKGINGVSTIFQSYLDYLNKRISKELDIDPDDNIVFNVISIISTLIYNNNGDIHIDKNIIKNAIKHIDTNSNWSKTILFNLEKQGLFVINKDCAYISYDRYRDFLTVKAMLADISEEKLIETKAKLKEKISLFKENSYMYSGLIDFLAIAVPEKWGFELIELYIGEELERNFIEELFSSFYHSISQRDLNAINENTIKNVEYLRKYLKEYNNHYWQALISCATMENHPLNANYLHEKLCNLSMADIDADWTQFISTNFETYYESGYHNANNYFSIKHIVLPFLKMDNIVFSDETLELVATLLIWLTTSTNKQLRDLATISAVNVLRNKEDIAIKLLNKFKEVKDIYLQERLYSVIYGISLFSQNTMAIDKIADIIFENVFKANPVFPNILIRDSAYGIIDCSRNLGNDISKYNNRQEPPFNYPKITEYPDPDLIKNDFVKHPGEDGPNEIYSTSSIYYSCSAGSGDFARYIVGDNLDNYWKDAPNKSEYCSWICRKAYELGWDYEKHGKFDHNINSGRGRDPAKIERIGKKYQWIAYNEYICNLADNYQKKKDWAGLILYSPQMPEFIEYRKDNVDSSLLCYNSNFEEDSYHFCTPRNWTNPGIYYEDLFEQIPLEEQLAWLNETQNNICKGEGLIDVVGNDNKHKLILNNFITEREDLDENELTGYYRDFGMHIRSFFCNESIKSTLLKKIQEKSNTNINGFNIYYGHNEVIGSYHQNFLEYPWSKLKDLELDEIFMFENEENLENYNTVMEYRRESGFYNGLKLYHPHSKLIEKLNIQIEKDKSYVWKDSDGNPVFNNSIIADNSICYNVPYVDKDNFLNLINKTDMSVIFSVSTEKRLLFHDVYDRDSENERYHWMYYFTLYELTRTGEVQEIYHHSFIDRI